MVETKPRKRDTTRDWTEVLTKAANGLGLDLTSIDAQDPAINDIVNALASIQVLRPAFAANPAPTSPQLARSLQATENVWRRIGTEFGLLTSSQVAELLGASPSNRHYASAKRLAHEIVGVLRGKAQLYPGFQFDRAHGTILPVMAPLIDLARVNGRQDADLILWLQGPTTFFAEEDRPVDHLRTDPEAVLAAAKGAFESEW